MRRIETYGGVQYVAYYLKVLADTSDDPTMKYTTVSGDDELSVDFVPAIEDLSPTPPTLNPDGTIVTTGDYLSVSDKIPFSMTT